MSDANSHWYYMSGSEQNGPVPLDQMRALAGSGAIMRDTLVWTDSMAAWQPIAETPLMAQLSAARPVAPQAAFRPAPMQPRPGQGGGAMTAGAAMTGSPGFVDAIKICFSKFATFSGRASRPELWYFYLFYMIVLLAAIAIDAAILSGGSTLAFASTVVALALALPTISVVVRRLHDTDRSGWYYWIGLIPLVGLILLIVALCKPGTPGANQYG